MASFIRTSALVVFLISPDKLISPKNTLCSGKGLLVVAEIKD